MRLKACEEDVSLLFQALDFGSSSYFITIIGTDDRLLVDFVGDCCQRIFDWLCQVTSPRCRSFKKTSPEAVAINLHEKGKHTKLPGAQERKE
jgi:hypothetical protein